MVSLALKPDTWSLALDASGNLAVVTGIAALAQDAATAILLFLGDYWFDTTIGIPYRESILGENPSIAFLKSEFVAAALTVPGVVSAQCFITAYDSQTRTITGQIQVTDATGKTVAAGFANPPAGAGRLWFNQPGLSGFTHGVD